MNAPAAEWDWSPDIVALGDRIGALSVAECAQLTRYLEEVRGLKAASAVEILPSPEDVVREVVEKSEFDVTLQGFAADKKMPVIKVVRELLSLGLKESKEFVEAAPKVVKSAISKPDAEAIKKKLEDAGATVSMG